MDILRNLFGSLTSGIIRLAVTVGILAAAYFFIVKPVLKTTSDAIKTTNDSFEKSFGADGSMASVRRSKTSTARFERQTTRHSTRPRRTATRRALVHCCIQHANGGRDEANQPARVKRSKRRVG